jgi:hypothetical protein
MKFDTKSESPKLFFKPMRWLTDEEHEASIKQGKTADALRAITMTVAQTDSVQPVAIEGKPPAKTKVKPEPEAVAEEVDEPEVRKEKAAPAPTAKKSTLADTVAEWDTDD